MAILQPKKINEEIISLPYNPESKEAILLYAETFKGTTLRDNLPNENEFHKNSSKNKGSFGCYVEEIIFQYQPNSRQEADFSLVEMELKTTPFKQLKKSKKLVAKERLVLSMINYMDVVNEKFETSTFIKKAADILLIGYLYQPDKDPLDYQILFTRELQIPENDLLIIKKDWQTIVDKVKRGEAHLISGADTYYLEACTKGANAAKVRKQPYSDIPAKPRAWAFKQSYLTSLVQEELNAESISRNKDEEFLSLADLLENRLRPYYNCTIDAIAKSLDFLYTPGRTYPKHIAALLIKRILGINKKSKIEEFQKADISIKTIRLTSSGSLKEALSFPAFSYNEVATTPFEESDFFSLLQKKFFFVIFQATDKNNTTFKLVGTQLWQMPERDYMFAKKCYDTMQKRIKKRQANCSVKVSENPVCHVRPHARNKKDIDLTPYGEMVVKKSFWLNASYLAQQINLQCTQYDAEQ